MRVLVPEQTLARRCQQALREAGEAISETVDVVVWDIDSRKSPPPAEMVITARPVSPTLYPTICEVRGLQHLHLLSLGYDWVLPHLEPDVTLTNSAGAIEDATAELAVTLALSALRELPRVLGQSQRRFWDRSFWTRSLAGARILVLGYGGVGSAVVSRLEAFMPRSINVVASRSRKHPDGRLLYGLDDLPWLLSDTDVLIITLPSNSSTHGLIGEQFLSRLPDGALLVNVGRGTVVDAQALMAELHTGRIDAALDVVEPEPLPSEHPLWETPNLLLTPHIGGNTHETLRRAEEIAVMQLLHVATRKPLLNLVSR